MGLARENWIVKAGKKGNCGFIKGELDREGWGRKCAVGKGELDWEGWGKEGIVGLARRNWIGRAG